jgi:hypothetical protein
MAKPSLAKIRSEISAAGLRWQAADNPISRLPPRLRKSRLGLAVPSGERERLAEAVSAAGARRAVQARADARDWRDVGGDNFVTPIKDQGNCGSCVSFAAVATIESQARIERRAPSWAVDLSEAELFFCGGAKCADGWWPTHALAYAARDGIGDEACMPYSDRDQACNLCSDKADRMLMVGDWQEIAGVEQRKQWLDATGPMIACFAVYDDFFAYTGGIYEHATGDLAGYNAVSCVGFNDTEGYWLCKNSWGQRWGDGGFFKIAYGQAEIDTSFAMYGVASITGTLTPDEEQEEEATGRADYVVLQSSAGADVVFAHVNGAWRHLAVTDARAGEIGGAALVADLVTVSYEGERITVLSSWKTF